MSPMMGPVVLISIWCLICGRLQSTKARVFNPVLFFQKSLQDLEVQADANPCCYPTQFQSNVHIIGMIRTNPGMIELSGTTYVDGKKLRAANKYVFANPGGDLETVRQVILFNPTNKTATTYSIGDAAQHCTISTAGATFDQSVDPCFNGATLAGDSTIGFKDWMSDSLKVKSWVRNIGFTKTRVVSDRYCAPISDTLVIPSKSQTPDFYFAINYYGVTSKLDESVFLIPKFCNPKNGTPASGEFDRIFTTFGQAFLYNNNKY